MDNFNTLCSLVSQANLIIGQLDLESVFNSQTELITNLTKENLDLKEQINGLDKQIKELNFKYDKDMELLGNELKSKQEELANLTKVSYIQSLNKQLTEKTNYCQILESQLDKLKRDHNQASQPNPVIEKLAKKAAEAEAELKAQKEESEKAKLSVGKKSKKQNLEPEQPDVKTEPDVIEVKTEPVHVVEAVEKQVVEEVVDQPKPKKSKKSKKYVEEETEQIAEQVTEPVRVTEQVQEVVEQTTTKKNSKSKKQMVEDDEEEIIIKQEQVVEPVHVEEHVEVVDQPKSKKNKKSKKPVEEPVEQEQTVEDDGNINPENFQDINGFELLEYKSNYYWRDLETSELYDNIAYKPGKIVGLINGKGKVKLH
jgi:hypothetical protein